MHAVQALGAQLVALPDGQFKRLQLDSDALREALEAYRKLPPKNHEARRRQLQFIGKVMRGVETAPITQQLEAFLHGSAEQKRVLHQAEHWRERFLNDPKSVAAFLDTVQTDAQILNQHVRAALKARERGTDRGEARALFRILVDALSH